MDGAHRRPQLPALSYLDVDKVKREDEAYHARNAGTPQSLSTSAAASPTYPYPSGPPPPYSHAHSAPPPAQHANSWPAPQPAVHTPPESRRTSENEREGAKQSTRQSLPSISEALGVDSQTAFASTAAPSAALPQPQSASGPPASPSPTSRRSYPMEPPQGPPTSFPSSTVHTPFPQYRPEPPPPQTYPPPPEAARAPAAYPPAHETKPPLQLQTSQAPSRPAPATFPRPPEPSPAFDHPASHSAGSMGPPSSFPYGYTPYPPRYAIPTPPSSVSSGPIYQPSAVYGAAQPPSSGWKSESASRYDERHPGQAQYSDNVKRHLDFYDLEAALNDIASTSGILSDFSRRYGDRMHQTQRSGASLSTLPGLVEVDDMITKSRVQLDALMKIRDVVLQQQAVYEQQAADQRHQQKAFGETSQPPPDSHHGESEDHKAGGFAGVDTKKRRGRAAPPGRCHSCNRAETPEWRRGPDGARTLCNACGLHYAKLTRKNNGANKNTSVGSSNLRPKENMLQ
ncbi:GATA zinc finger domain-containing 10 [Lecanosticta acicola]|uniref:GATA zinc finger domain-containing 10 n=1 Tax=Lecanosticta acicola TaxID=111012 RepID=A0AAI8Z5I0_9PEZI|nr:GATA zinc finger domain-containing 10 [Lecanosticta acicola]